MGHEGKGRELTFDQFLLSAEPVLDTGLGSDVSFYPHEVVVPIPQMGILTQRSKTTSNLQSQYICRIQIQLCLFKQYHKFPFSLAVTTSLWSVLPSALKRHF